MTAENGQFTLTTGMVVTWERIRKFQGKPLPEGAPVFYRAIR